MPLAAHWFGRVKFRILVLIFSTVPAWRKTITNIQNSTYPNQWATKDISIDNLFNQTHSWGNFFLIQVLFVNAFKRFQYLLRHSQTNLQGNRDSFLKWAIFNRHKGLIMSSSHVFHESWIYKFFHKILCFIFYRATKCLFL